MDLARLDAVLLRRHRALEGARGRRDGFRKMCAGNTFDVEGYPCPHSAENLDQWRWRMVQGLRRCAEIASDTRGLDAWSPIGVIQFVPSSRILNGMRTLLKTKGDDSLRDVFCCDRVTIGRFGLVLKHYEIPHPHPRLVRL